MSKKNKSKKKGVEKDKSSNTKNIIIAVMAIVVIALAVFAFQIRPSKEENPEPVPTADYSSMRRGETRPTLSPTLFSDPFIADTYQIAKDIPEVLDSLYCYCYCDRDPFRHVSLLSCFVDKHAAG
jgi:hypothetical protein